MSADENWLDTEPTKQLTELKRTPEYEKAVAALQQLSPKQRLFLDCLLDACLEPRAASKLMRKRHGILVNVAERKEWFGEENFARAVTSLQEFACNAVAISKAALLGKLNKLANDCRKVVPYEDKLGNRFNRPVDASAAHATLVTLAKITGQLKTDASAGVTINANGPAQFVYQIISSKEGAAPKRIEGSGAVIDAEVTEVKDSE
jgi:hypothetical protein